MRTKILGLIAIPLLAGPMAANALPVVSNAPCPIVATHTCSSAIAGLDVSGTVYDVTFVEGTFLGIFPDPTSATFWGDGPGATAAVAAIAAALFAQNPGGFVINDSWLGVVVPVSVEGGLVHGFLARTDGSHVAMTPQSTSLTYPYAFFSAGTSVPEPGTLALLGLGLAGLSLSRRRKA